MNKHKAMQAARDPLFGVYRTHIGKVVVGGRMPAFRGIAQTAFLGGQKDCAVEQRRRNRALDLYVFFISATHPGGCPRLELRHRDKAPWAGSTINWFKAETSRSKSLRRFTPSKLA